MDSRVSADSAAAAETKEWARTIAIDKVSAMTESCCQLISKRMRQAWEPGRFARAHRKNFEMPYARGKSRRELPWWWWKLLTKTACLDTNPGGTCLLRRFRSATRSRAHAQNTRKPARRNGSFSER